MVSQGIVWLPLGEEIELFCPFTTDWTVTLFFTAVTFAIHRPLNSPDKLTGTALGSRLLEVITVPVYVNDIVDQSSAHPACWFTCCKVVRALLGDEPVVWLAVFCRANEGKRNTPMATPTKET